jgi:hypothetical protein
MGEKGIGIIDVACEGRFDKRFNKTSDARFAGLDLVEESAARQPMVLVLMGVEEFFVLFFVYDVDKGPKKGNLVLLLQVTKPGEKLLRTYLFEEIKPANQLKRRQLILGPSIVVEDAGELLMRDEFEDL